MEQSSFFFCSLSKLWIESNFASLAFMKLLERVFSYFSCLELNDFTPYKPKIFWGRTPRPPHPRHIYDIKTTMCLCTEAFNCTKKTHSLPKINLDVDLNHTSAEGKEGKSKLNPLFSLSLFFFIYLFIFFFACQKYSDSWNPPPPPTKIPWSVPAASSLFCTAVSLGILRDFPVPVENTQEVEVI